MRHMDEEYWEDKLTDFYYARQEYEEMNRRDDGVHWSEVNEQKALDKYLGIQNEILSKLMER